MYDTLDLRIVSPLLLVGSAFRLGWLIVASPAPPPPAPPVGWLCSVFYLSLAPCVLIYVFRAQMALARNKCKASTFGATEDTSCFLIHMPKHFVPMREK